MQGTLAAKVTKDGKTFTRGSTPTAPAPRPRATTVTPPRPVAAVRPPGRPPDDHRRGARPRRQRGARGHPRRARHRAGQPGRHLRGEPRRNSRPGSMYVVKPKMHGPDEVAFTDDAVRAGSRSSSGLPPLTIKLGIMDEERRTSLNLKACIARRARPGRLHQHRIPGPHRRRDPHLDAGRPDGPQGRHEVQTWIKAYEDRNVDIGLECGLPAGPRSARACGPRRTTGRRCWSSQDRPPAGRRDLRVGAVADGRDPARAALPPGRRGGPAGGAGRRPRATGRTC